jgi:putative transposase
MVSPGSRRRAVKMIVEEGLGRTAAACRALELGRSSYYRGSQRSSGSVKLEGRIVELSEQHPRYGCRRVTALLRRDGAEVNAKRVQRVQRVRRAYQRSSKFDPLTVVEN